MLFRSARYVTGAVTAVAVATVCIPVMQGLRRSGVLRYVDGGKGL